MPILLIVQITLGKSTNLDPRIIASAHQAKTSIPVFGPIVGSDRYDPEGQLNTGQLPIVENAQVDLRVPLEGEFVNKDIIIEEK